MPWPAQRKKCTSLKLRGRLNHFKATYVTPCLPRARSGRGIREMRDFVVREGDGETKSLFIKLATTCPDYLFLLARIVKGESDDGFV